MKPTELFASRIIRAARRTVFDAWTQPDQIKRWWGPPPFTCPVAEIDLRVGGAYRLANLGPDGKTIWISGSFSRVEIPSELSYSWQLSTDPSGPSLIHVRFLDHPAGTEIRLHHERFASEAIRDQHADGWVGCLGKLSRYLSVHDVSAPER
jgi:uncharacterized protein YndB with AHSA1/START domain